MTNEEKYLNSKLGKKNPFTVPEGYFEQLTAQVMERIGEDNTSLKLKLPEKKQQKPAIIKQLRPWLYAAACLCVGAFTAAMFFNDKSDSTQGLRQMATLEQENTNYYSDSYIDEEADYAMLDNQEIYACLLAEM